MFSKLRALPFGHSNYDKSFAVSNAHMEIIMISVREFLIIIPTCCFDV
jgi:hypothetical protein